MMVQTQNNLYVWIICYKASPKQFLYNFKNPPTAPTAQSNPGALPPNPIIAQNKETKKTNGTLTNESLTNTPLKPVKPVAGPVLLPESILKSIKNENRDSDIKDEAIQNKVNWILKNNKIAYRDLADIESNIYFSTYDIYLDEQNIYFKFNITNTSPIAYDIDFMSFEIKHAKGMKARESTSALVLRPAFRESVKTVFPDTSETIIYAIKLYAFSETDKLNVKLSELGGRRGLEFFISSKIFTNAKPITL